MVVRSVDNHRTSGASTAEPHVRRGGRGRNHVRKTAGRARARPPQTHRTYALHHRCETGIRHGLYAVATGEQSGHMFRRKGGGSVAPNHRCPDCSPEGEPCRSPPCTNRPQDTLIAGRCTPKTVEVRTGDSAWWFGRRGDRRHRTGTGLELRGGDSDRRFGSPPKLFPEPPGAGLVKPPHVGSALYLLQVLMICAIVPLIPVHLPRVYARARTTDNTADRALVLQADC